MYPTDFGNSTYMVSVPAEQAAGAVTAITRLLTHIGYRGMFSAEFKRDPRDDVFKILEVNARAWWYVDFAARSGVDVCRMAYEDALERPVGDVTGYQIGRTLVFPYTDYFACVNLWRQGRLSLWAWLRSWMTSSQPVFQVSDPAPGALATASILTTFVRQRLRTLLPTR
jgi:predicted ATP-grasp superfamily ATP-dependent carboligase